MTQLILNAKISKIIKVTSSYANFKREFNLFTLKKSYVLTKTTINRIKVLKIVKENINKMQ